MSQHDGEMRETQERRRLPHSGIVKTIYVRNILSDLWKRKLWVLLFVILCSAAAVCLALRPGTPANLTDEQKEELAAYDAQLKEYDAAISELEAGINDNSKQIDDLKNYIDNSIYMQIDPENIQTAVVQYGLQTEGNIGNILNSFITYINDGGLRESVAEKDKDLQPEYWRDVISCYINSNILNVTVIHYDAEKCARILEIVKQRILEHAPEVKAVQGEFTLTEMESTQFVKADAGLVNGQNGHRNNLKGYETGLADLRSRLVSYRTNKANYIENNEPDFAPEADSADAGGGENARVRMVKYALTGIILGVIAAFAAVTLSYILSDRLRSAEDLRDSGLNVLGICKAGNGKLVFQPEPARVVMDIQILAQPYERTTARPAQPCENVRSTQCSAQPHEDMRSAQLCEDVCLTQLHEGEKNASVFLNLLHEDAFARNAAETYRAALAECGISAGIGNRVMESAEELKEMVGAGCCLLFAEAGKTTYQELRRHIELCERFRVAVLGCVVIE